jgi:spermidine/putrescine transport system permease protein
VAAFLVSFTTSFDEFALAFFLIGPEPTLPVYIYSQLRFPSRLPIVVTMASVIMVASVMMIVFSEYLRQWGHSTPTHSRSEDAP